MPLQPSMHNPLRYGNNPHQTAASYSAPEDALTILNGEPSHINLLDLLTGWQITRDIWLATGEIAATSIKHCVPVGVANPGVLDPFTTALLDLSVVTPELSAYLRARSSDWGAAYGDMVIVFGIVDEPFAQTINRLVSDGIAATGYTKEALEILKAKKNGRYLVAELNKDYVPPNLEKREIMGIELTQQRNDYLPSHNDLEVVVGEVDKQAERDLILASISMKYTVSNNIVLARNGRTLAITAGQQSRILSTQLACEKYENYQKLQLADAVEFVKHQPGKLTDRISATVQRMASTDVNSAKDTKVILASDGFIPFRDNIELAAQYGVNLVLEPEGAVRGDDVIQAVREYDMTLVRTRFRFFYH